MKKLLFIFATAALTLTSCSGNSSNETTTDETNIDSLATAFENGLNTAQDSATIADLIGKASADIKALEEKGDTAAIKAYKWKLQELVDKNKDKLQNMGVVSAISEITNVENLSKQVTDALKTDAKTAKSDAEDAAVSAAENSDKVQEAKNKIEDTQKKVEETKKAVNDVKSATQNAKDALNSLKKK